MFMERASSHTVATNIVSGSSCNNWPQCGATTRGVVVPINDKLDSLIFDADAHFLPILAARAESFRLAPAQKIVFADGADVTSHKKSSLSMPSDRVAARSP